MRKIANDTSTEVPAPVYSEDTHLQSTPPTINLPSALYVVATPMGNLGDISQRALDILKTVDVIACEDTRHTSRLLQHYGIKSKLLALHEHNELEAAQKLVNLVGEGKTVALVTDAGTPAVSDPGARAVAVVRAAGVKVVPVPGPNAAIAALSASGAVEPHFLFYGFLPPKSGARCKAIADLKAHPYALVFYEAPHRIVETINDLAAVLEPHRTLVIARELTKLFESIVSLPLAEAPAWLAGDDNRQRGEFVLIVSAAPVAEGVSVESMRILQLLLNELPLKQAVKLATEISGESKNVLYEQALLLKKETSGFRTDTEQVPPSV